MVEVPGGEFEMGSNAFSNEQPIRQVWVDTFWIDETEVTVEAYKECVDAGVCTEPSTGTYCNWSQGGPVAGRENHPVNCVSWFQAEAYCEWVQGGTKRLPTEAEWEKAARGTDGRVYPWGDTPQPSCDRLVMSDAAAGGAGCGTGATWEVGSMPLGASPYGVQDMAGNVWEWVADWYGYYDAGETNNPVGPRNGTSRVLRGGSWFFDFTSIFRAAYRDSNDPTDSGNGVGLRCARTPSAAQ
ncbi:MAG: SUMF1/EgtB/PvdO family nonheme iron enzyme [Myxococcota bacterium]